MLSSCSKPAAPPNQSPASVSTVRDRRLEGYPLGIIKAKQAYSSTVHSGRMSVSGFQAVVSVARTWTPNKPVTVAFLGGSTELRTQIENAISPWLQASSVKFDFKDGNKFREWHISDSRYAANIRIAFLDGEDGGYWSLVGQDSINPSIVKPNQASMNFEGFTNSLPSDWQATVLHEFGHALGFDHEHQNPNSPCEAEFRWQDDPGYVRTQDSYGQFGPDPTGKRPGIYTRLEGPLNNWSQPQVDFNLRQLAYQADLLTTSLDKQSIMMYSFPDWMFANGKNSACYTAENLTLSPIDIQTVEEVYPKDPTLAKAKVSEKKDALRKIIGTQGLAADIRSQYSKQLNEIK